jgi:hypothetical protein
VGVGDGGTVGVVVGTGTDAVGVGRAVAVGVGVGVAPGVAAGVADTVGTGVAGAVGVVAAVAGRAPIPAVRSATAGAVQSAARRSRKSIDVPSVLLDVPSRINCAPCRKQRSGLDMIPPPRARPEDRSRRRSLPVLPIQRYA